MTKGSSTTIAACGWEQVVAQSFANYVRSPDFVLIWFTGSGLVPIQNETTFVTVSTPAAPTDTRIAALAPTAPSSNPSFAVGAKVAVGVATPRAAAMIIVLAFPGTRRHRKRKLKRSEDEKSPPTGDDQTYF
ncbi:MAG: hypothetical protein Q9210_003050 [Variospora velana]